MDASKDIPQQLLEAEELKLKLANKLVVVVNKIDQNHAIKEQVKDALFISAKQKEGLEALTDKLLSFVNTGTLSNNQTIVSNSRHVDALNKSLKQIIKTIEGLNSGISGDFLAMDIRQTPPPTNRRNLQMIYEITSSPTSVLIIFSQKPYYIKSESVISKGL